MHTPCSSLRVPAFPSVLLEMWEVFTWCHSSSKTGGYVAILSSSRRMENDSSLAVSRKGASPLSLPLPARSLPARSLPEQRCWSSEIGCCYFLSRDFGHPSPRPKAMMRKCVKSWGNTPPRRPQNQMDAMAVLLRKGWNGGLAGIPARTIGFCPTFRRCWLCVPPSSHVPSCWNAGNATGGIMDVNF